VDFREKLSRKKRWEQLDEEVIYTEKQLDKEVVNPSQIRTVIKGFLNSLPEIFPGRKEIPKTLIFAKTDSHADDIINIVREEFNEGNAFCKKVTYKAEEDPKSVLAQFRNDYNPRIVVTVDMIATGTDVKPLECLLFMRDVKSKNYFEQMLGRGTRTLGYDDLKKVTPSAVSAKTHFVIVDAVGVTKTIRSFSRPLERKPGIPLKDLLNAVTFGAEDEDLFTTLAGRLGRLEKQLTPEEKTRFTELANGKTINQSIKDLLFAYDPDQIEILSNELKIGQPDLEISEAKQKAERQLLDTAREIFSGVLNDYIENVRRCHEQIIDTVNLDETIFQGWENESLEKMEKIVQEFKDFLEQNKDEITALKIFYNQPYRLRELTFEMLREVLDKLKLQKPNLAPGYVWQAFKRLEEVKYHSPKAELIALVSLIRRITGIDTVLTPYDKVVDRNFQTWVFKKNAGKHNLFTDEQMNFLRMIKEHIATSLHFDFDDLDLTPFDSFGGKGRMWQLFGENMNKIIDELNEALVG
ncbi:MAG: restriction endonuclease subunit R, partial [Candidatus Cloacimonetes bacterium]|nr:restriction endonuclease subunit R [Candidatus Cloacimonadota bacterium]